MVQSTPPAGMKSPSSREMFLMVPEIRLVTCACPFTDEITCPFTFTLSLNCVSRKAPNSICIASNWRLEMITKAESSAESPVSSSDFLLWQLKRVATNKTPKKN